MTGDRRPVFSEQRPARQKAPRLRTRTGAGVWWILSTLLTIPVALIAQNVGVENPVYEFSPVGYVYKETFRSLPEIEFKNFTFFDFDGKGQPRVAFNLKDGSYERGEERSSVSCWLGGVHLLGKDAGGAEQAVALFDAVFIGGSSSNTGYAQVLELANGQLRVVYQISFDTDGLRGELEGWRSKYEPAKKALTIRASHYMPGDAHCCISAIDVVTFRWTGKEFVRQSVKTEPSEYGKKKAEEAKAKKKP
ncbi:MAG: hypothetical protein M1453_11265 [Acidobacteria bacterium]|nr:hypothetical protein [Acidobacteriota bacterium]